MCWEGGLLSSPSSPGTALGEEEQSLGSHEGSTNAWGGGEGWTGRRRAQWQGSKEELGTQEEVSEGLCPEQGSWGAFKKGLKCLGLGQITDSCGQSMISAGIWLSMQMVGARASACFPLPVASN